MKDKNDKEYLNNLRHSCAHLLAAAVLDLWPGTHNAIGPAIENGFYQDFDFGDVKITDEDLGKIEQKMREFLNTWDDFQIKEVSSQQARKDFAHNPYKLELADEFAKEGKTITETVQGSFLDLCKGGHVENPKKDLKHFKLLSIAGAYWRGSEKNKMLTRIYGTSFPTKKELDDYSQMLEESKKRDHKKLGRQHELFFFHQNSPGMAYWLPKGLILYRELLNFSRKIHHQYGYQEVSTPSLNKKELYETSGHWKHYRDDMFISPMSFIREESDKILEGTEVFGVKPMNCPNAMNIFAMTTRSYKDLPLRLSETSVLHRFEPSGTLNGLFRAREFRQDDAHIFIANSQLEPEFKSIMEMIDIFYSVFDINYRLRFGTRPKNFMGAKKDWDLAEKSLQNVLDSSGKEYTKEEGEGAFYGPKVDILMKDSLGREWQTGTIQLDFQQPKNFNLHFIDQKGNQTIPSVIHRAIYGSFERFIGILIEHYAGILPVWLSPVQATILPLSDKFLTYAQAVAEELKDANIRVEIDQRNETLQAKIRDATLQKIPFLLVVGAKEQDAKSTAVRSRRGKDLGQMALDEFKDKIKREIETKS